MTSLYLGKVIQCRKGYKPNIFIPFKPCLLLPYHFYTFGCSFIAQVCRFENTDCIARRNTQLPDKAKFSRLPLY